MLGHLTCDPWRASFLGLREVSLPVTPPNHPTTNNPPLFWPPDTITQHDIGEQETTTNQTTTAPWTSDLRAESWSSSSPGRISEICWQNSLRGVFRARQPYPPGVDGRPHHPQPQASQERWRGHHLGQLACHPPLRCHLLWFNGQRLQAIKLYFYVIMMGKWRLIWSHNSTWYGRLQSVSCSSGRLLDDQGSNVVPWRKHLQWKIKFQNARPYREIDTCCHCVGRNIQTQIQTLDTYYLFQSCA